MLKIDYLIAKNEPFLPLIHSCSSAITNVFFSSFLVLLNISKGLSLFSGTNSTTGYSNNINPFSLLTLISLSLFIFTNISPSVLSR